MYQTLHTCNLLASTKFEYNATFVTINAACRQSILGQFKKVKQKQFNFEKNIAKIKLIYYTSLKHAFSSIMCLYVMVMYKWYSYEKASRHRHCSFFNFSMIKYVICMNTNRRYLDFLTSGYFKRYISNVSQNMRKNHTIMKIIKLLKTKHWIISYFSPSTHVFKNKFVS